MGEPEIDVAALGEDVHLLEGIRTTRAIRRLRPDPVPAALIRKVCEAGTFAPSGGNRQPWFFVAVTDPVRREFVAERYRKAFAVYIAPDEYLGLPDEIPSCALLPIGWPVGRYGRPERKPVDSVLCFETFDPSKVESR